MWLFFLLLIAFRISLIASSIEQIQVRENVNVTITCQFEANKVRPAAEPIVLTRSSEPIILWYKDETDVIGVNSISNDPKKYSIVQHNRHRYQLTIINAQLESAGVYKCQNFTAKEENRFQLTVIVPPTRLQLLSIPELLQAERPPTVFQCISERAFPLPTFEWYKNDRLIQRSLGNRTNSSLFSSVSVLTLSLTPADDQQLLRCQVFNEGTVGETKIERRLDVQFPPMVGLFWNDRPLNGTLQVIEKTSGRLHCRVSANPSLTSPIEWLNNDQLMIGESQAQLTVNFTSENRMQNITCRATNPIGQSEASVHLRILYQPKLSMVEQVTLNQDESLVLQCTINASPPCHRIRWSRNDEELSSEACPMLNSTSTVVEYRISHVSREHAGKYTCQVFNWLPTSVNDRYEANSAVSTEVAVQYPPFILNVDRKLAIVEDREIVTECLVDANPKAEIVWFGPTNQRLNVFATEKPINSTLVSSELHLPASFSTVHGRYRCVAKNSFGERDFTIEFQSPGLPDPVTELRALNITDTSFVVHWQPGYDGGLEQIFHLVLHGNHSEEKRQTKFNSIGFRDLQENTAYQLVLRSRNTLGDSPNATSLTIHTKASSVRVKEIPSIDRVYYLIDRRRLGFQLKEERRTLLPIDDFCLQYYDINSDDELLPCSPLRSLQVSDREFEVDIETMNLRVKLCFINESEICSRSLSVPTGLAVAANSSDWILILVGAVLGLCLVIVLLGLCLCLDHRRRKDKSKSGSTDTLKTNSISVRVSDTSPSELAVVRSKTYFYNPEHTGVYSIHEKKNSMRFDSGMPSTTSNNSDSVTSQGLSSSDFDERSDADYLVNGRPATQSRPLYVTDHHWAVAAAPIDLRRSSEESGFSTPTDSHRAKKLVYEVVV